MPNPLEVLINEKQQELASYQSETKTLVGNLDELLTRFSSIANRSAVVRGEKRKLKHELEILDKEIETLASKIITVRNQIENKRLQLAHQKKFLNEIRKKTQAYQEKFYSIASQDVRRKEINEIEMKIEKCFELKKWIEQNPEEASAIISGERLNQVRDEFSRFKVHRALLEQKIQAIEQNTKATEENEKSVRRKIDVLKKRNAAQLTRLKKQIAETKQKNEYFRQRAYELENDIFHLKSELNEIQ